MPYQFVVYKRTLVWKKPNITLIQLSEVPKVEGYKIMVASLSGYKVIRILFKVVTIAAESYFLTS